MASSKVEKVAGLLKMPSTVVLPSACVRLSQSCAVASRHTGVCSWVLAWMRRRVSTPSMPGIFQSISTS
jgi:hypothetical protein